MSPEGTHAGAKTRAAWVLAGTVLLAMVAWSNLSGLGIGSLPLTYDDTALPRLVVAVLGALLAWVLLLLVRPAVLLADVTWAALSALGVWSVVSALSSEHGPLVWLGQSERLEGVVTIILYGVLFSAGLQVGRSASALKRASIALIIGASILAFHGVLQMFSVDPSNMSLLGTGIDPRYPRASLGNANFFAGLLVLVLPVAVAWLITSWRGTPKRFAWGICVLVLVVVLLATRSQGAWLAAIVEGALGLATAWVLRHPGQLKRALTFSAALVAAGVALILAATALGPGLGATPLASGSARLQLVQIALSSAAEHPLTGAGPDTYLAEFRQHRGPEYYDVTGDWSTNNNAHSWFPQFASTLGFPGALLLIASVGLGLWRARPRIAPVPAEPAERVEGDGTDAHQVATPAEILRIGVWIGLIGVVLHLQLNVAILAFTVPFWILLGILSAPRAKELRLAAGAPTGAALLAVVLLALAVFGSVRVISADAAYMQSRVHFNNGSSDSAIERAEEAVRLNPTSVKYSRGLAQAKMQLALDTSEASSVESAKPQIDAAEAAFQRTIARWPSDYPTRAWLAAMRGRLALLPGSGNVIQSSRDAAQEAARLDRVHWEVASLASGVTTPGALNSAISVPGLP